MKSLGEVQFRGGVRLDLLHLGSSLGNVPRVLIGKATVALIPTRVPWVMAVRATVTVGTTDHRETNPDTRFG
eukprot:1283488-Rhodomonas_salina.8